MFDFFFLLNLSVSRNMFRWKQNVCLPNWLCFFFLFIFFSYSIFYIYLRDWLVDERKKLKWTRSLRYHNIRKETLVNIFLPLCECMQFVSVSIRVTWLAHTIAKSIWFQCNINLCMHTHTQTLTRILYMYKSENILLFIIILLNMNIIFI